MTRRVALAALAALLASVVPGADPVEPRHGDPSLDLLGEWTTTALERLRIDGSPPPHRVVASAVDGVSYTARASFGDLVWEAPGRQRRGSVEVVVGADELDSSRYYDRRVGRWGNQEAEPRQEMMLAIEDGELAFARDLWRATDVSYKKAVQRWRTKVAARRAVGGDGAPADWSAAEPVVAIDLGPLRAIPEAELRRLVEVASSALDSADGLDRGEVTVNVVDYRYYTTTSDGTRLAQPEGYAVVHAFASLVRDDGVEIADEVQWVARDAAGLPPSATIVEEVRALGRNVLARAAAADVDYYEGPVVFEDRAAAELFRYLVPPEIMGTPPAPEPDRSYRSQTRQGPRLGRRLLPDGWSVVDDPGGAPGVLGGYLYDREGVRGERVELVSDGFVRDLLMTRVPRAEKRKSTGHARGSVTGEWTARPSRWRVGSSKNLTDRTFDREVARALDRARTDRLLVVRRMLRSRPGQLPQPSWAVWRYADGREEPVDVLEFDNVDRRTLRGIAAAGGGELTLGYLAPWDPDDVPDSDTGLPMVVTAPRRLLVEDMELVFPGPDEQPHAYPSPAAAAARSGS
jgi:hypothetical protein